MSSPTPPEKIRQLVQEINNAGGSYHKFDVGSNLVIDGIYDMTKYLHHYGIPEDLTGKTVLDIGTSTGFFAFQCAPRNAQVTAIDLGDGGLFNIIGELLGLDVRYVQKSVYEFDSTFGQFDLVVCGALLLHLRDIFGAIERIRSVCQGEAGIATATMDDGQFDDKAYCEFIGSKTIDKAGEYWVYWCLNATALEKMLLAAGFSKASRVSQFTLESEPSKGVLLLRILS